MTRMDAITTLWNREHDLTHELEYVGSCLGPDAEDLEYVKALELEAAQNWAALDALLDIVAVLDRRLQEGVDFMPVWFLYETSSWAIWPDEPEDDCPACGQPTSTHTGEIHCDDDHGCMLRTWGDA